MTLQQARDTGGSGGPSQDSRTVVIATAMPPNSFDTDQFAPDSSADSPENFDADTQTFDRLMTYATVRRGGARVQDTGWPAGELAEWWKTSPDGLHHVLRLREATSACGNRLSAEDVVWSWHKAFAGRLVGRWVAFMGSVRRGEAGVRALDDRTVEFTLEKPNLLFPHTLTIGVPPIFDSAEARRHATPDDPWALRWLRENPCGFGPYTLDHRAPGEMTLRARDDYWAGPAGIERVTYRQLAPDRDRVDALIEGEADLLFNPTPQEIARLRGRPEVTLFSAPGNSHLTVQMDARLAPFDNPHLRRALAWAVPYHEILTDVYQGAARPWRGVAPDTHPGFIECPTAEEDIERSKSFLREGGHTGGFSAALYCDGGVPTLIEVAERISRSAARAGIELEVTPLPTQEFKARQTSFSMPLAVDHDGHRCNEIGYGLPHDFGDRRHGITNWVQYSNDEVNRLIDTAEHEIDPARRLTLFAACQRIIASDTPWAFVAQPNYYLAARRGLRGFAWFSRNNSRPRAFDLSWD